MRRFALLRRAYRLVRLSVVLLVGMDWLIACCSLGADRRARAA
jgi:hypothetical protein